MSEKKPEHFEGKDALAHVIEARLKSKEAFSEMHGSSVPAHLFFATDAIKETSILSLVLWISLSILVPMHWMSILLTFILSWLFLKTAHVAYLGWARLERLHRLITEERWEIEHHREQEKEELIALYRAKGFSGKLLDEVIDVLMSDDHYLLQIMLEEELGLTLKAFEHPLRQAFGAFIGVLFSSFLLGIGAFIWPSYGIVVVASLLVAATTWMIAKKEKRNIFRAVMYAGGIAGICSLISYYMTQILSP